MQPPTGKPPATHRGVTLLVLLGLISSCGGSDGPTSPNDEAASLVVVSGDQQQAAPGQPLPLAPTVRVLDGQNRPVSGATVTFAITAGGGTLEGASSLTDAAGEARLGKWTLGTAGVQTLAARTGSLTATFRATLTNGPGTDGIQTSIGTNGGTFTIDQAGHPYRGLQLAVPSGTFSGAEQLSFTLLPQPTGLPSLPAGFHVSGPVLAITSSQGRGSTFMTLRVPISHAPNEQVVLAFHDPARRVTELLPLVYRDDTLAVALVSHLRPDLMPGPGLATSREGEPIGWLMPVSYPVPLPNVASVLANEYRWPVLDYGSATHPKGFGAAIPLLQSLGASLLKSLAQVEPALTTPGLYGDGAELAAVTRTAESMAGVNQLISQYLARYNEVVRQIIAPPPKEEIDELANQLVVAALAINRKPFPVALTLGSASSAGGGVVVTAVSGSDNSVGLLSPTVQALSNITRQATGFLPITVQEVGGGQTIQVDRVTPLSSFLVDFGDAARSLEKLLEVSAMPRASAARKSATEAMMVAAGLPLVPIEVEAAPGTGYSPLVEGALVARSQTSRLRVTFGGSTIVELHTRAGGQVGEMGGSSLAVEDIPPVQAAAELQPTDLVIAPMTRVAGVLRQVSARLIQVVKAPFSVTPAEVKIVEPSSQVTLTASVPQPPQSGYAIEWKWGGGQTVVYQNTPTATITFEELEDDTVTATLRTLPGNVILASDTIPVVVDQAPHWQLETFSDADDMLEDEDLQGSGPIFEQLQRIVARPHSTMLSITQITESASELQLRTLMSAEWDPAECCPPVPHGSILTLDLGSQPGKSNGLGPYFSPWNTSSWTQTSTNLSSGTMSGQSIPGTVSYNIKDVGVQTGPAGAIRMTATRNGTTMTGMISIYIWFVNQSDGKLAAPPDEYRFPFTAKRVR